MNGSAGDLCNRLTPANRHLPRKWGEEFTVLPRTIQAGAQRKKTGNFPPPASKWETLAAAHCSRDVSRAGHTLIRVNTLSVAARMS